MPNTHQYLSPKMERCHLNRMKNFPRTHTDHPTTTDRITVFKNSNKIQNILEYMLHNVRDTLSQQNSHESL